MPNTRGREVSRAIADIMNEAKHLNDMGVVEINLLGQNVDSFNGVDENGKPFTAHTTNEVPFILVNYDPAYTLREGGCLADIVPTLIETMGMTQPEEMTGKSLLIKK